MRSLAQLLLVAYSSFEIVAARNHWQEKVIHELENDDPYDNPSKFWAPGNKTPEFLIISLLRLVTDNYTEPTLQQQQNAANNDSQVFVIQHLPLLKSEASPNGTSSSAVCLGTDGSHASIKLYLPGAPPIEAESRWDYDTRSSAFLNFTVSDDQRHLTLNWQPVSLAMSAPVSWTTPKVLFISQLPAVYSLDMFYGMYNTPALYLDYELDISTSADPSVFDLRFNLIGAGKSYPGEEWGETDVLLADPAQKIVELTIKDHSALASSGYPSHHNYSITAVKLLNRPTNYFPPRSHLARQCSISMLSWRCADLPEAPYHRQIWRFQWDDYGRIGSLQWAVARSWDIILRPMLSFVLCPAWCFVVLWKLWLRLRRGGRSANLNKPLPLLPFERKDMPKQLSPAYTRDGRPE